MSEVTSFCSSCGRPVTPGAHFCTGCGAPVGPGDPAAGPPTGPPPGPPGPTAPPPPPPPPPGPAAPLPYPPPAEGPKRRRTTLALVLSGVGVLAVVALVVGVLVLAGGDEAGGEVFLEAAATSGPDPFTDSTAALPTDMTAPTVPSTTSTASTSTASTSTTARGATTVTAVAGDQVGLYGGSLNQATCDVERQITYLQQNRDKAAAFAQVLGIPVGDIPGYLRSLTPMVLTRDTRVTNHGFSNGRATARQAVLQAGTAVLVDVYGVPRVKCGCGNPLTPPVPTSGRPRYRGNPWPGFSPTRITVITQVNVQINIFVIVDVISGGGINRPPGWPPDRDDPIPGEEICIEYPTFPGCEEGPPPEGTVPPTVTVPEEPTLGSGDVQVTLRWSSTADLDLAVTDPTGARISYEATSSPSGGQLDVDANGACAGDPPVENVFWPPGQAPLGEYLLEVHYYGECAGEGPQSFTLAFVSNGGLAPIVPAALHAGSGEPEIVLVATDVEATAGGALRQEYSGSLPPGGTILFKANHPAAPPPGGEQPPTPPAPVLPTPQPPVEPPPQPPTEPPPGSTAADCAPTGVQASAGTWPGGTDLGLPATVTWQAPSGCEVQSYTVTALQGGSATGSKSVAAGTTQTTFTVWGNNPAASWTFQVVAVVGGATSPAATSNELSLDCSPYGSGEPGPEQMAYTLCMHDPTADDPVGGGGVAPQP
ncbi:MAG: zinc-ribbon domain-containing protein [Acidimicrobiales bacterium]|nr:zinc-ribbon domain-containing protein [Acidimicrobiales bacterium]